jgi:hypothetical protein
MSLTSIEYTFFFLLNLKEFKQLLDYQWIINKNKIKKREVKSTIWLIVQ